MNNDTIYDYHQAIYGDCVEALTSGDYGDVDWECSTDSIFDKFYDELFISDSVTGNGSGSYFFNSFKAEQALAGNYDLLEEAFNELGAPCGFDPESFDVSIRCYLLHRVLREAVEDLWDENNPF